MHDLTPEQYDNIWQSGAGMRADMGLRRKYYDGDHAIVKSNRVDASGAKKSERVSNFVKYGVDLITGSIAGTPYNVTDIQKSDEDGNEIINTSPERYREIGTANNFDSADVELFRNALIYGWSLETHEFIDDEIVITSRNPLNWMAIYNSGGDFIGLIHRSQVDAMNFVGDVMLDEDLEIMVVYTDTDIITFNRSKGTADGNWFEPDEHPRTPHHYDGVPAVVFRVNESMETHISNDLIGQQDEYNEIDSSSGDDIRYDSDGVLAIKGFAQDDVKANAELIREWKVLALPPEGDAFFIKKGTDEVRITSRLKRTRENIFMSLSVPDVNEIVGSTGSTSGIALQLKFKPMADNAQYMIANIRVGIRERIALINSVVGRIDDAIENVQINISFSLPVNRTEEWQNIGSVSGIVSKLKQLEMLSDVEDPAQEQARLLRDAEDNRFIDRTDGTPEEIVAINDAQINALATELQPQIALVIDSIADAVLSETTKRGGGGDNS